MKGLLRRLRGVRVEPRQPPPRPLSEAEWRDAAAQFDAGPGVVGATGGSGTRVVARIVMRGGMFLGDDRNRSEDALDFGAFADRWVSAYEAGRRPAELVAELRALVARQHEAARGAPWGWKEPRSIYLLQLLADELPGLRFLHVVRDGRDMAYSENQVQLRKHGRAVLGDAEGGPSRSIALWSAVNLRAADLGERVLGNRYLRVRFEDLCAEPAATTAAVLDFFSLAGDAAAIARDEVAAPQTLGRWRTRPPEEVAELEREAAEALRRFGYQSSSA